MLQIGGYSSGWVRWAGKVLVVGCVATLGACAHKQGSHPRLVASAGEALIVEPRTPWSPECPIVVTGAEAVVTDLHDGITLELFTRTGDVQELRRRAVNLAAAYNREFDEQGPSARVRYVNPPARLEGGGYGVRGGEGSKQVTVTGRPPSRALVEVVPRGAKIHFRTESPLEVRHVRARVTRQAVQMWAGTCPTAG